MFKLNIKTKKSVVKYEKKENETMLKEKILKQIAVTCLWDSNTFTDEDILVGIRDILDDRDLDSNSIITNEHEALYQIKNQVDEWGALEEEYAEDGEFLDEIITILNSEGYLVGELYVQDSLDLGFDFVHFPRELVFDKITRIEVIDHSETLPNVPFINKWVNVYFMIKNVPFYEFQMNWTSIPTKQLRFNNELTDLNSLIDDNDMSKPERESLIEKLGTISSDEVNKFTEEEEAFLSTLTYRITKKETSDKIKDSIEIEVNTNPDLHEYRLALLLADII